MVNFTGSVVSPWKLRASRIDVAANGSAEGVVRVVCRGVLACDDASDGLGG